MLYNPASSPGGRADCDPQEEQDGSCIEQSAPPVDIDLAGPVTGQPDEQSAARRDELGGMTARAQIRFCARSNCDREIFKLNL